MTLPIQKYLERHISLASCSQIHSFRSFLTSSHCIKGGAAKIDQEASGKGETRPCQVPPAGDAARHEGHGRTSADCRHHASVLHVETGKTWGCGIDVVFIVCKCYC